MKKRLWLIALVFMSFALISCRMSNNTTKPNDEVTNGVITNDEPSSGDTTKVPDNTTNSDTSSGDTTTDDSSSGDITETPDDTENKNEEIANKKDFGAYLGLTDESDNYKKLLNYKEVAIEIGEYSSEHISLIKDNNTDIYAYLSVGSLENYKDYYNEFKNLTFMDYDNWPDERWIDVSSTLWADKLVELATKFKSLGATGLFLDNYDVYYIVCSEYKCSEAFKEGIYTGLKEITKRLKALDLKLIINSGTDFLERLDDEKDDTIRSFYAYNQESVFSTILDYENDVFGTQSTSDREYYQDIIAITSRYGIKTYLLEYTTDEALIQEIKTYCELNGYTYYISSHVNLT